MYGIDWRSGTPYHNLSTRNFFCVSIRLIRTGFRDGQAGCLHNHGTSKYVLSPFIFWYSRVGWASSRLPRGLYNRVGCLHICLVTFYFIFCYSRVGWTSRRLPRGLYNRVGGLHICLVTFYFIFCYSRLGWTSRRLPWGSPHMSCHLLLFGILG